MKLIEADKVKQAIKDYWKAQVDRLPIPKNIEEHDAYANRLGTILEYNSDLLKEIEALPSAEPDTTTHDSIPAETGKNDGDRTSGDCISRQAAIDEIHEDAEWLASQGSDWQVERMERDKSILMSLPSVQPERKTGHWVEIGDEPYDEWECDVCGFTIDGSGCIDPEEYRDIYRFCPNCGADMRGEQE